MRLNAKQLREADEIEAKKMAKRQRKPIYFILENVYDTYNVGGLFRLADALNIEKMYLCGDIETPPNHRIQKASIGTYKIVPWEYKATATEAINELRATRLNKPILTGAVRIVAVEQAKGAIDYRKADYTLPLALVLGNETAGITQNTLSQCDQIVEIPMWGINKSLNVIVSAAIVGYGALSETE